MKLDTPVVAGRYYPSDTNELAMNVDGLLTVAASQRDKISQHIVGIIAPHAGYEYSGKVAAYAYSQLKNHEYKTVVVIGMMHNARFNGIAFNPSGSWNTPLGSVAIDEDVAAQMMRDMGPGALNAPHLFAGDHTIEAQLPFLQRTVKNFKIVPILFGVTDETMDIRFATALARVYDASPRGVLVVASTDLTHYKPDNEANVLDTTAISHVKEMNIDKLYEDLKLRNCEMCSGSAVIALLRVAQYLNAKPRILGRGNSGDFTKDRRSVVGYMSAAFVVPENAFLLNKQQRRELLNIARTSLDFFVKNGALPEINTDDPRLEELSGAFITLKNGDVVRGCRGYTRPELKLADAVSEMATNAARDPRFPPLTRSELSDTQIEISVLGPLRQVESVKEIELGRHGIYFCLKGKCAVFLPSVPVENNWSIDETMRQLARKAGMHIDDWRDKDATISVFTAQVFAE